MARARGWQPCWRAPGRQRRREQAPQRLREATGDRANPRPRMRRRRRHGTARSAWSDGAPHPALHRVYLRRCGGTPWHRSERGRRAATKRHHRWMAIAAEWPAWTTRGRGCGQCRAWRCRSSATAGVTPASAARRCPDGRRAIGAVAWRCETACAAGVGSTSTTGTRRSEGATPDRSKTADGTRGVYVSISMRVRDGAIQMRFERNVLDDMAHAFTSSFSSSPA